MNEAVFDRARQGDEQAFRELVAPYRGELQLHCYRILGSLTDAEDMLQETLLAAWRGLDTVTSPGSLRAWLYRIATNRCLNGLRATARRRPRPEPVASFDPPEPTRRSGVHWLQPYPDALLADVPETAPGPETVYEAKEAVRLAFVSGLQQLPPRQAAVLVLRDALGFSLAEVAEMLDITSTAAKGALQRARATLDRQRDADHRRRAPDSAQERDLSRRFAEAFTGDDIDGVVALLTDDAWLAMPPAPHEYQGRAAISAFLRARATGSMAGRFRLVPTRANGQPAFACYLTRRPGDQAADREVAPGEATADAVSIMVLAICGDRISGITHFLTTDLHERFGLPEILEP